MIETRMLGTHWLQDRTDILENDGQSLKCRQAMCTYFDVSDVTQDIKGAP